MWAASDPNMHFHSKTVWPSPHNHQMLSFQPTDVSAAEMSYPCTSGAQSKTGAILAGDTRDVGNRSFLIPLGSAEPSLQLHPAPGLRYDTGLTMEWSSEEQLLLEEDLVKYDHEPNIMKYIQIAARLQNKSVRDVALRCQWMARKENGKRSKQEKFHAWRKMKERKDKQVDSLSAGVNAFPSQPSSVPPLSSIGQCSDPTVGDASQHLLEENAGVLDQIKLNLDNLNLRENMELFFRAKDNLESVLNRMTITPAMAQMACLPVSIDNVAFSAFLLGSPILPR